MKYFYCSSMSLSSLKGLRLSSCPPWPISDASRSILLPPHSDTYDNNHPLRVPLPKGSTSGRYSQIPEIKKVLQYYCTMVVKMCKAQDLSSWCQIRFIIPST